MAGNGQSAAADRAVAVREIRWLAREGAWSVLAAVRATLYASLDDEQGRALPNPGPDASTGHTTPARAIAHTVAARAVVERVERLRERDLVVVAAAYTDAVEGRPPSDTGPAKTPTRTPWHDEAAFVVPRREALDSV